MESSGLLLMSRFKVFIVGPSLKTQGGISSVNRVYIENFKDELNMKLISSYYGKSRLVDVLYFINSIVSVLFYCLTTKNAIFHLTSASRGSFLRKSMLARICKVFNKKVVFHIHGAEFDKFIESSGEKKKRSIIEFLKSVDKLIVLSEAWKSYFAKYVKPECMEVISNPCPFISEKYNGRKNKKLQMLFVGRMGQRKGTYDLIEAIRKLGSDKVQLQLFGDGDVIKVQEMVAQYGLDEIISVNGWVSHEQLLKLYDSTDLLLLPSYAEGLPMAILEAMGRGLPIISTNVGGIPEAVIHEYNGYIINPGDVEDLKNKIELFLKDADLIKIMGIRSLELSKEKFAIDSIKDKLKLIYKGLYSF